MGVSGWNAVVFAAVTGLWIASGTQREKPVLAVVAPSSEVQRLEGDVAYRPSDPRALRDLAQAYLDLHHPTEAEATYNQIIANPGIDPVSPIWPLAHLGLARAYAMQNKPIESSREYKALFSLWKNADPDLPVLQQAHREYAQVNTKLTP